MESAREGVTTTHGCFAVLCSCNYDTRSAEAMFLQLPCYRSYSLSLARSRSLSLRALDSLATPCLRIHETFANTW